MDGLRQAFMDELAASPQVSGSLLSRIADEACSWA